MPDIDAHKRYFKRILHKARNENVKRSYVTVDANGKQKSARKAGMESSTRKRYLYAGIRYLVTVAYVRLFVSIRLFVKSFSRGNEWFRQPTDSPCKTEQIVNKYIVIDASFSGFTFYFRSFTASNYNIKHEKYY